MKRPALWVVLLAGLAAPSGHAQMKIGDTVTISFASVAEARKILTARDDFARRMSPFDRAARMKTDRSVSEEEYLGFVGENILDWDDQEKQQLVSAFEGLAPELRDLAWAFPKEVLLIKTTGREEGGAAYTRANAVILPQKMLAVPVAGLRRVLCHELFHVISRANPALRERLYAAIGFVKCNEPLLPEDLAPRMLTNPDAPRNDHCIRIQVEGQEQWAIPVIFSCAASYDVERGGEFFRYLTFRLLLVERNDETSTVTPLCEDDEPKLVKSADVSDFFEQIGRNTGYIIHPEEVLADNFMRLKLKDQDLPSPEITEKMEAILKQMSPIP